MRKLLSYFMVLSLVVLPLASLANAQTMLPEKMTTAMKHMADLCCTSEIMDMTQPDHRNHNSPDESVPCSQMVMCAFQCLPSIASASIQLVSRIAEQREFTLTDTAVFKGVLPAPLPEPPRT